MAYKPVINAAPSCPKTMYKTMTGCVNTARASEQKSSVQTFDQQLYVVAKSIKSDRPCEFENHVLRIGGMHSVMSYCAAKGWLFSDAGLRDILADSKVYAAGSVDKILKGEELKRGLRALPSV